MKKLIPLLLIALLFTIGSCKKDASNPASCTLVTISNNMSSPATWTKDNVYIIDGTINIEATLTIQAGTIIKFKSGNGLTTANNGNIQALGTASEPIIFTAYTDDSYCGDNNGDGTATTPVSGYWGGIRLQASIASQFTYCKMLYAGANNPNAAGVNVALDIRDYPIQNVIDHCTFAHTSGGSNQLDAAVHIRGENALTFTNNTIYDNGGTILTEYPIIANYISNTNVFHNPANAAQKNVLQGIYLAHTLDAFTDNTNLTVTEIPYVIMGHYPTVSDGKQVVISDNVILKFEANADVAVKTTGNSGFINGQGTGVLFTSIKDDTGGDSNGDGAGTTPATGDWVGIYDRANANTYFTWGNIINDQH